MTIPSPGGQTSLDTSLQENIDIGVQYNVTMTAVNEIGASQPSSPFLFTKQPGTYVHMCTCVYFIMSPKLQLTVMIQ